MTIDFQTWMRAVWESILEPSAAAQKAVAFNTPRQALWMALALAVVLNVILLGLLQYLTTTPVAIPDQPGIVISPFGFTAVLGVAFFLFVFATYYGGQVMGGIGTLEATLAIVVWFQAISLTLEAIQLVLILISPAIAGLFGLLSVGALVWCFVNFVNVLHGFDNLGKAIFAIILALVMTAMTTGVILALFGFGAPGATV